MKYIETNSSKDAIREARKLSFRLNEGLFKNREKVEGLTIDSPSSKDLDDALNIRRTPNGWILDVSIADVASLVKADSYLDKEAFEKVFTRYFKGHNDPMIPHVLSENKLSLLENEKRPTLTFSIPISKDFEIGEPEIKKTYIESKKRMSYKEVDSILRKKQPNKLKSTLSDLQFVTGKLNEKRTGKKEPNDSHLIVQESMILANKQLAQFCADHDIPILFRNQASDKPNSSKNEKQTVIFKEKKEKKNIISKFRNSFHKTLLSVGEFMKKHNSPIFTQKCLKKVKKITNPELRVEVLNMTKNPKSKTTVGDAVSGVINKAEYSIENEGHHSLEMDAYTHATSPIRRYADLVNHRIFSALANEKPEDFKSPYEKEELETIANQINSVAKAA